VNNSRNVPVQVQILDREYLLGWGLAGSVFGLGMERLIRGRLLEGR